MNNEFVELENNVALIKTFAELLEEDGIKMIHIRNIINRMQYLKKTLEMYRDGTFSQRKECSYYTDLAMKSTIADLKEFVKSKKALSSGEKISFIQNIDLKYMVQHLKVLREKVTDREFAMFFSRYVEGESCQVIELKFEAGSSRPTRSVLKKLAFILYPNLIIKDMFI